MIEFLSSIGEPLINLVPMSQTTAVVVFLILAVLLRLRSEYYRRKTEALLREKSLVDILIKDTTAASWVAFAFGISMRTLACIALGTALAADRTALAAAIGALVLAQLYVRSAFFLVGFIFRISDE